MGVALITYPINRHYIMSKFILLTIAFSLVSCFSMAQNKFSIKQIYAKSYTIEGNVNEKCSGFELELTNDKFLNDWAYTIQSNLFARQDIANAESLFFSCLIEALNNSSDVVSGSEYIRIRFELRALIGIFEKNSAFREAFRILNGKIEEKNFYLTKELSKNLSDYSLITSLCKATDLIGYLCGNNLIDIEPPIFNDALLGMDISELAKMENFGFPNDLLISLTLKKK
tara:strand:- start:407 stop:1090 length:684 start_codon:yes stop_codon:yes gene_type:complete